MRVRGLVILTLCAALVGCGGSPARQSPPRAGVGVTGKCQGSQVAAKRDRQRQLLRSDLGRLRAATLTLKHRTESGNAKVNSALDRFLLDVAKTDLNVHERSRFIDRAAAIVAPRCYLCFQALESSRPFASGSNIPCD